MSAPAAASVSLKGHERYMQTAVVYYDLETTGLNTNTAETIELAAQIDPACKRAFLEYYRGKKDFALPIVSDAFAQLVCPDSEKIPEGASKINGIYMDPEPDATKPKRVSVRNEPKFSAVAPKWIEWLLKWRKWCPPSCKQVILVAHNNFDYDAKILMRQLKKSGIQIPDFVSFGDSLPTFRNCFPYPMRKFNMQALVTLWCKDKKVLQDHRAASDVEMLILIIQKCPEPELFMDQLVTTARKTS